MDYKEDNKEDRMKTIEEVLELCKQKHEDFWRALTKAHTINQGNYYRGREDSYLDIIRFIEDE